MKKAKQFQKYKGDIVRCSLCNHRCIIKNGKTGICGARYNKAGVLYTLYYGKPIAIHIDPVEKKPLYHFLKGTNTYSFGTLGCNFRCDWCQNWEISQGNKAVDPKNKFIAKEYSPQQLVKNAIKYDCRSISYTYTEPTIFFEYALDTMKLAHRKNLKNIWVSNGYFSAEAFQDFSPYLDAINADLKGFKDEVYQKYCGARLEPVLENLKRIKKTRHIHLEITTLLIPGINDDEQ
jgi:pyruvate formate lyase activating enzyme